MSDARLQGWKKQVHEYPRLVLLWVWDVECKLLLQYLVALCSSIQTLVLKVCVWPYDSLWAKSIELHIWGRESRMYKHIKQYKEQPSSWQKLYHSRGPYPEGGLTTYSKFSDLVRNIKAPFRQRCVIPSWGFKLAFSDAWTKHSCESSMCPCCAHATECLVSGKLALNFQSPCSMSSSLRLQYSSARASKHRCS